MSQRKRSNISETSNPTQGRGAGLTGMMKEKFGDIQEYFGTELIVREDGSVEFSGFQLHRLGVIIDESINQETWENFGQVLAQIGNSWEWIVADWLAYGNHKYGDGVYNTASELFGKSAATWADYAYVARNVQISERSEILGVFNHKPIASYNENPELQRALIQIAEEHRLSKKDFERIIEPYINGREWQLLLPEKLGVLGKARLKQEDERIKIRKKLTGKNRKEWVAFAREQAKAWQQLIDEIEE